jgi:hypothetical protein
MHPYLYWSAQLDSKLIGYLKPMEEMKMMANSFDIMTRGTHAEAATDPKPSNYAVNRSYFLPFCLLVGHCL